MSPQDKVHAFLDLKKMHEGVSGRDLSERLSIDPSLATRYLSYERGVPDAQRAFDARRIRLKSLYEVAKAETQEEQQHLLAKALAGAGVERLGHERRTARNGSRAEATRSNAIRCAQPGGVIITIKGQGISLLEGIEHLQTLLKKMKKATEEGLDAGTFSRVLADQAKTVA